MCWCSFLSVGMEKNSLPRALSRLSYKRDSRREMNRIYRQVSKEIKMLSTGMDDGRAYYLDLSSFKDFEIELLILKIKMFY